MERALVWELENPRHSLSVTPLANQQTSLGLCVSNHNTVKGRLLLVFFQDGSISKMILDEKVLQNILCFTIIDDH